MQSSGDQASSPLKDIAAEDARDPALEIARRVQEDFPHVSIRIHPGARALGLNPKVNLLAALFDRARYDAVLISDSNVRVGPEAERICHALLARDVCTDFRGDGLRISPHFFTDEDDVDRCFTELATLV